MRKSGFNIVLLGFLLIGMVTLSPKPALALTTPTAPKNLTATAISANQIKLQWNSVSKATSYWIYRSASSSGTYVKIATVPGSAYNDTGLKAETTYYYRVKAVNSSGSSPYSTAVSAKTTSKADTSLATPENFTATATSSSEIELSWDAVSKATSYNIYRSGSSDGIYARIASPTANTYTDTGLKAETTYYYRIKAVNSAGSSPYSTIISAKATSKSKTNPATPENFIATATSSSEIKLSWDAVSKATSYNIYRSGSSDGTYARIASPTANAYTDTGLKAETTYYYKVKAVNSAGSSPYSTVTSTKTEAETNPAAPENFTATATSSSKIKLSWDAVSNAASYNIYRSGSSDGTYAKIASATANTYTDAGLEAETAYYYKVQAVNNAGSSPYSTVISAKTTSKSETNPAAPENFTATATSSSEIKLSWDAVSNAVGYYIYRSGSSDGTYVKIASATANTYTDTGLKAETTYYYKVKAVNSVGLSPYSTVISAKTKAETNPAAPENFTATATSSSEIKLSWDAVSNAASYDIYRSGSSTRTYARIASAAANTYTDTGLVAKTVYYYKIKAVNSAGSSLYTEPVSATTLSKDSSTLPAPTSLIASATNSKQIKLTWKSVSKATSYYVFRSYSLTGTYTKIGTTGATNYSNAGLKANTKYYYKVKAVNKTLQSDYSSVAFTSTKAR